mmetsp:Transcript_28652/g.84005  ORF Transcript_28652/g.84005 Transcript_28652/m.84005 type:complete len:233 (-) Transcript_28652:229-927(-)
MAESPAAPPRRHTSSRPASTSPPCFGCAGRPASPRWSTRRSCCSGWLARLAAAGVWRSPLPWRRPRPSSPAPSSAREPPAPGTAAAAPKASLVSWCGWAGTRTRPTWTSTSSSRGARRCTTATASRWRRAPSSAATSPRATARRSTSRRGPAAAPTASARSTSPATRQASPRARRASWSGRWGTREEGSKAGMAGRRRRGQPRESRSASRPSTSASCASTPTRRWRTWRRWW